MAYLPDEQNPQSGGGGPSNGQANSMASQAPITTSPAPTAGGSAKTINQASSQGPAQPFTNLQTYLTANAPQIQAQGDQIAGQLNSQYGAATGAVDNAAKGFSDQVKAGYTPQDQSVVDKFNADPTAVANDANAAKSFTGMYNDNYTGPGDFASSNQYGAANDQVQKGSSLAKQVSTPDGVKSYLMGQNPNETAGMGTLDSSLIAGNPNAVQTVTDASKQFDQLPGYLTSATNQGNAQVQSAIQEAQAAKAAATGAFDTKAQGFNAGVNQKLTDAVNNAKQFNTNFNDITGKLTGTSTVGSNGGIQQLTPQEEAALNMSNSALGRYASADDILSGYDRGNTATSQLGLYNGLPSATPVNLAQYLSGGHAATLPAGLSSVASKGDFDEASALAALSGGKYSSPLDQSEIGQAGTYQPNGVYQSFDTAKANGLFDTVNSYDKATAGDFSKYNGVGGPGTRATDYNDAYKGWTDEINKAGNVDPNAQAISNALNRLANGFDAPPPGYTAPTTPPPPSLGGGVYTDPVAPPPPSGPGRVSR